MDEKNLILIVDDQAKNLQLLAAVLYKNNYEIAMADSGKSALEMVKNTQPDLILLDIMMPEMDGFDVISKIKDNPALSDIPVIFLTAKTDNETVVRSFESGAADYVTKPFNPGELLSRVNTHLQLSKKSKELLHMNNELENIVKERTSELNKANIRLSNLDEAKSYFISLLSHELRTPISGIKGFTNMIKNEINDKTLEEYCDYVLESTSRLEQFTNMSLLITKLKTEKYQLMPDTIDINTLIQETLFGFQDEIKSKNIKIKNKFCKKNLFLNIDAYLISSTLRIIIENAIKFNKLNGSIFVETVAENNEIIVIISDTGQGFSQNVLEKSFDLFSSGDIMSHSEGFGLGLAAAKIIMDYHSGDLHLSNNSDNGATVKLFFKNHNS